MSFKKPTIKRTGTETLNKVSKQMKKDGFVEVGVIDAGSHDDSVLTVAAVAAFNELGMGVPERSFIRSTMKDKKAEIKSLAKAILKNVVKGKTTTKDGLGLLGEFMSDEVRKKIVDIRSPPNTAETIAKKRSSNPLIDTSQLKNSITYEVKNARIK